MLPANPTRGALASAALRTFSRGARGNDQAEGNDTKARPLFGRRGARSDARRLLRPERERSSGRWAATRSQHSGEVPGESRTQNAAGRPNPSAPSTFRPFSVIDTEPHVNVTLFIAVTTADVSTHWTTLASPRNASFFGVRGHRTVTDLARADFT